MSSILASNIHAVSHSLSHRGPSASRARSRWQPYSASQPLSAIPAPPRSSSSPNAYYLNSPPSSVSSASPSSSHLCDTPEYLLRRPTAPPPSITPTSSSSPLHETQKAKYVTCLVGQSLLISSHLVRSNLVLPSRNEHAFLPHFQIFHLSHTYQKTQITVFGLWLLESRPPRFGALSRWACLYLCHKLNSLTILFLFFPVSSRSSYKVTL